MSDMKTYVVSFIVIAFFAFAFISFSMSYQSQWGGEETLAEDDRLSSIYSGANNSIRSSQEKGQERNETLYEEDPSEQGTIATLIFGGVSAIAQSFSGIAYTVFGSILDPVIKALGLPREAAVILGSVLTTIFLIVIVLLGWQLLRTGR